MHKRCRQPQRQDQQPSGIAGASLVLLKNFFLGVAQFFYLDSLLREGFGFSTSNDNA